jgi:hypothetical protein
MKTRLTPLAGGLAVALACCLPLAAAWAAGPEDTLRDHFARISSADYTGAAEFFSGAFRRAFKGDVKAMDTYYLRRREQLVPGYEIIGVTPLADPGRQTARVTVDFNDPDTASPVQITERLHYYLIREKVAAGAPLRDRDGLAWRIDIYDALSYDSLAAARRRPYLYTLEAWPDDLGRELKSRQGLYRIQQALEEYRAANGAYPGTLYGEDNRRDPLIKGKQLADNYPPNGFNGRWMRAVDFGENSSGDFSYYGLDADKDGQAEGYFLLLHGKVPASCVYTGRDSIMLLGTDYSVEQSSLARQFAAWWQRQKGKPLTPGPALGPGWGGAEPAVTTLETATEATATPPPPTEPPGTAPAKALVAAILRVATTVAGKLQPQAAVQPGNLVVHSYGLPQP